MDGYEGNSSVSESSKLQNLKPFGSAPTGMSLFGLVVNMLMLGDRLGSLSEIDDLSRTFSKVNKVVSGQTSAGVRPYWDSREIVTMTQQAMKNSGEGVAVTLLVRHLPEAIPHDILTRLFSHYGASSVRPFSHGRVKNCAFVDFKDELPAYQAQRQLHGLRFLGKVLSVERASKAIEGTKQQDSERVVRKDTTSMVKDASSSKGSSHDYTGSNIHASEPIAEKLGVDYPFPPHLEYAYPPPDGNILTNIVNALIAVPRFYTQVLHLMNKMNIPAPFRKALPTPPLPASIPIPSAPAEPPPPPPPPPPSMDTNMEDFSSSESEMESSDEEVKRVAKPKRKRAKRQAIVGPAVDKDVAHEAVGLKQVALIPKEKPIIKKKNPVLQIRISQKQNHPELQEDSAKDLQEPIPETSAREPFATLEELNGGKLPPEEILSLPKFKNYSAGDPTPVLYIKNLAKDVVVDDLYFLFGSFFGSVGAAKSNLTVKLMQEGRMRGQAFVTFPTVELARNALSAVNGFVFKGKPIVIQFGRSPKLN